MKSMKYKIGPFELNKKNNQCDERHVVLKNKLSAFNKDLKSNNSRSQKIKFTNQKNDHSLEIQTNYDGVLDELNEMVMCEVAISDISNKKRIFTKSNTSFSTNSSTSLSQMNKSKEDMRMNTNSPVIDTVSSSESGFGTTGDEEIEIQPQKFSELSTTNSISTLPTTTNKCQPLPQEERTQGLISQQQTSDSNESRSLSSLPIIHPPSRQIIFSGLTNSNNKNNSDDAVKILTNDNSSLSSSVFSMNSSNNNRATRCCSSFFNCLIRFYYSCFCCYSTTSHTNQTPLIWSWLSIFCCCCPLLGGISLFLNHRSKTYKRKQNFDLADKYSKYAEAVNIASLIFGVVFYAIAFFLITLVIFMYWRPHNS